MLVPRIFDRNFNSLFDEMFSFPFEDRKRPAMMQTDVKDLGEKYQLDIELPGYAKEDIHAQLKDGYLTIQAEHTDEESEEGKDNGYVRKERYTGSCQRSFFVGERLTQEDINAKFENGILRLVFPKEEQKPVVEEKKYIMIE